jgi:hypothetical protein
MFDHQNTCARVGDTDTQSFKDVLVITVGLIGNVLFCLHFCKHDRRCGTELIFSTVTLGSFLARHKGVVFYIFDTSEQVFSV